MIAEPKAKKLDIDYPKPRMKLVFGIWLCWLPNVKLLTTPIYAEAESQDEAYNLWKWKYRLANMDKVIRLACGDKKD